MANLFIKTLRDEEGNEIGKEEWTAPDKDVSYWEQQPDMERADSFVGSDGEEVLIPISSFGWALENGMKPKREDPGVWEAIKTGAAKGFSQVPGMSGFSGGRDPATSTVEEELAYQQHPIAYPLAYGAAMVGPGAAAAALTGYGAAKVGKMAAPYAKPAMRAGAEEAMRTWKSTVPLVAGAAGIGYGAGGPEVATKAGLVGAAIGGARGLMAAGRQAKESYQLDRDLKQLTQQPPVKVPMRPPEDQAEMPAQAPKKDFVGLSNQGEEVEPGLPVLDLMNPTEKSSFVDWLATKAGGAGEAANYTQEQIKEAANLGAPRRAEAYGFIPERAAKSLAPQLRTMLGGWESERGEEFGRLFKKGIEGWNPATAIPAFEAVAQIKQKADDYGATGAKPALTAAERIMLKGEMFQHEAEELPMTPGLEWASASKEEQFNRLWNARKHVQQTLRDARSHKITLGSVQAERALEQLQKEIQASMHSNPDVLAADKMWTDTSEARKAFFKPMEMEPGTPSAEISPWNVKTLLGQNAKAYKIPEAIGLMASVLERYGDQHPRAAEYRATVNAFKKSVGIAEDKRLLEAFRQTQGPSSPAVETALRSIEHSPEVLEKYGATSDLFRNPAMAMKGMTEFAMPKAQEYFGAPWNKLNTRQQNDLMRLFIWHKTQGLKATPQAEKAMMKQLMNK